MGIPVDFEVEDHLGVVASLAAQNAFDIVVIGDSLIGHAVDPAMIVSLAEASHTTPVLILGQTTPEFKNGAESGGIRVAPLTNLCPSSLLREVRYTLEMHVKKFHRADQDRRIGCLKRIFENMIERMPYGVAVTDVEGFLRYVNEAACKLWNQGRVNLVGSRLVDHPEEGRVEILNIGDRSPPVEIAPVPIEWLGNRYFLTSVRQAN
ncbi:MAG: PAS domain-containing protein [Verrucomicrobiales bacterium]|jgi:PAS domain-containing protein